MIQGIDISHGNDSFNFDQISPDIKFVWCKASQGGTFKDPAFNAYWQRLKNSTLYRGAYHFLTFQTSAEAQAENFLSLGIDFSKPNVMPPMLDVEDQVGRTDAETKALNNYARQNPKICIQLVTDWLRIVSEKTGRTPVIYSYKNFFAEYLQNTSWDNPLWLAAYQNSAPGIPKGWNDFAFWQFSQRGSIHGPQTGGDIDWNYFNGSIDQLSKL